MASKALYGFATHLGLQSALTAGHITAGGIDFQSESLVMKEEIVDTNGLRGTRARSVERIRNGPQNIRGQIHLQPTPVELALLLKWCFGGTTSGSPTVTYPLADSLQAMFVEIARDDGTNGKDFVYAGNYVDKVTFKAAQGGPLDVLIDVIGQTETVNNAGTYPALTLDTTTKPFIFPDCAGAVTINSTVYDARDFELTVFNHLQARFFNNLTANNIQPQDRNVDLKFTFAYPDVTALYGAGLTAPGGAGLPGSIVFTVGGSVLNFSWSNFVFPKETPSAQGRPEILYPVHGHLFKSGTSTLELVTSLNATP